MKIRKILSGRTILTVILLTVLFGFAQLPKLPDVNIKIPGLDKILQKEPAITSSIKDAVYEVPFLDGFDPEIPWVIPGKPQGSNAGVMLKPCLYEAMVQSYCLHAGTYGPSKGDGYAYAPLKGQSASIVKSIIRNSLDHPEIKQEDIQELLWAVVSRTKLNDMPMEMQASAAKLLTPKQLVDANGGALGLIPKDKMEEALEGLPPQVQQALQAEADLRSMLTSTGSTYEELERVAVLTGAAPKGEGSREVPRGRWSLRPEGFFVRYFPDGYPRTLVQVYAPEKFSIQRDARGRIVSVTDPAGNQIAFEYDDAIAPAAVSGDQSVKGYAFKKIRFLKRQFVVPEAMLNLENGWDTTGWTLVGVPAGKGKPGTQDKRFAGLAERYKNAVMHQDQLKQLDRQFKPNGLTDDIIDLAHLSMALAGISRQAKPSAPWLPDHIHLIKKAWQFAVAKRACGITGESPLEYAPTGNTAMPGNTACQRIETSLRPVDGDETNQKDCATLQRELKEEEILLAAYEDMQVFERAVQDGLDWEGYDAAVMNLAEWIYNNGGLDAYEAGGLTWEQLNDFFTSTPTPPGQPTAQTAMSTDNDGAIYGYDPSGNEVMIVTPDGKILDGNYQSVHDAYVDKYGPAAGDALFKAGLEHEMTHHQQAKTEGFSDNPGQHRRFEMAAYKNGIAKKKQAMQEMGCE